MADECSEALRNALATMGMVAADLKDQRDAREEECLELRGHVRNLLESLSGKVKARKETHRRVLAAEDFLMRPRAGAPRRVSQPESVSPKEDP